MKRRLRGSQTAGRDLMDEELELRRLWVCLVFLTLEAVGVEVEATGDEDTESGTAVPAEVRDEYSAFVQRIVDAKRGGATLKALKLDELLGSRGAEPRTAIETAVLSQSMRLCFFTMVVLDDERRASGEDDDTAYNSIAAKGKGSAPGPFIPGGGA